MATITAERRVKAGEVTSTKRKFSWTPYLFILPHLAFFTLFVLWPFIYGLFISLLQYDYTRADQSYFVGLDNYVELFVPGTLVFNQFWDSVKNTGIFVLI